MIKDHNATTNDAVDESWEMLPDDGHDEATTTPQISFCVVEPLQVEMDDINDNSSDDNNAEKRCSLMHHCQSTPDFHNYETILEETCNVEAVLIEHEEEEEEEDDEEECDGSSSMVMVSGPPSVLSESCWSSGGASSSSKISFRDAIMKKTYRSRIIAWYTRRDTTEDGQKEETNVCCFAHQTSKKYWRLKIISSNCRK